MFETETLDAIFAPSEDVVARNIEGELIIVPLTAGIGDMEDALFTLNETGRAIWERLDGKRNLRNIAEDLSVTHDASVEEIERDVTGLIAELLERNIIVKISSD